MFSYRAFVVLSALCAFGAIQAKSARREEYEKQKIGFLFGRSNSTSGWGNSSNQGNWTNAGNWRNPGNWSNPGNSSNPGNWTNPGNWNHPGNWSHPSHGHIPTPIHQRNHSSIWNSTIHRLRPGHLGYQRNPWRPDDFIPHRNRPSYGRRQIRALPRYNQSAPLHGGQSYGGRFGQPQVVPAVGYRPNNSSRFPGHPVYEPNNTLSHRLPAYNVSLHRPADNTWTRRG